MVKVKVCLVLTALLLSVGVMTTSAQVRTIMIAGRAVDPNGAPLSGAIVTLYYPPCRNCIDQILPASVSLPDGLFFLEATNVSPRGLKLFMREPVPYGFWSPLGSPPFYKLSHIPQFRGIPLRAGKITRGDRTQIDLGDVPVQIRWGKIIVSLSELFGRQYRPGPEDLGHLNLTLRDQKGKLIYDERLPASAFDSKFSNVNLALPEGEWLLEFTNNSRIPKRRSPQFSINVKSLGCTTVTVIEGQQRQTPCT